MFRRYRRYVYVNKTVVAHTLFTEFFDTGRRPRTSKQRGANVPGDGTRFDRSCDRMVPSQEALFSLAGRCFSVGIEDWQHI